MFSCISFLWLFRDQIIVTLAVGKARVMEKCLTELMSQVTELFKKISYRSLFFWKTEEVKK